MKCSPNFARRMLFAAPLLPATPALADTVEIVVPFAAGGPVDQLARILADELGPKLNANVIVDDRGGAGGAIGWNSSRMRRPTATRSCWRASDRSC